MVSNALLLYCKHHQIPIPREADKTLSLFGDGLALAIAIGSADRIEFQGSQDGVLDVALNALADA